MRRVNFPRALIWTDILSTMQIQWKEVIIHGWIVFGYTANVTSTFNRQTKPIRPWSCGEHYSIHRSIAEKHQYKTILGLMLLRVCSAMYYWCSTAAQGSIMLNSSTVRCCGKFMRQSLSVLLRPRVDTLRNYNYMVPLEAHDWLMNHALEVLRNSVWQGDSPQSCQTAPIYTRFRWSRSAWFQGWNPNTTNQKIVGNSLQPIGVIVTGNLFIKVPCWEL